MHSTCLRPSWSEVSNDRLERVHSARYIQSVKEFAEQGGGYIEEDTAICSQSNRVARMAASAVCDAVEKVVSGNDTQAFCLVRPPGHHALTNAAMGFCLFNNVAIGARLAIDELGLDRVLIVDWDVHHGNGTQAAFWEDEQVGFLSIHRSPFYPGTGAADEIGSGPGIGTTLNLPVKYGTPRLEYLAMFAASVERFAESIRPQLILISAGFDAHREDPFGSLGLESEDFGVLTRIVLEVAGTYANGRVVSVLEGGYNPAALRESVEHHLHEILSI
ncbi:Histone deacetylase-like amidohydrolase [Lignipirellula cremea]|uniref:histone deacetylase n=2 Tax=Lignipirellula cremea TaxID=2528010 RepID=A0A518E453_9BACT|nr:Histone deacetylase-like amidohydrolase [Lignipirellula cremea]